MKFVCVCDCSGLGNVYTWKLHEKIRARNTNQTGCHWRLFFCIKANPGSMIEISRVAVVVIVIVVYVCLYTPCATLSRNGSGNFLSAFKWFSQFLRRNRQNMEQIVHGLECDLHESNMLIVYYVYVCVWILLHNFFCYVLRLYLFPFLDVYVILCGCAWHPNAYRHELRESERSVLANKNAI